MSQCETVRQHLLTDGSITSVEAEAVYKIRRLASRIDELRKKGLPVVSQRRVDRAGQRYVRYVLKKEPNDAN